MASSTNNKIKEETGMEFLLRMRPSEDYTIDGLGCFTSSDFILLSTPCSYSKSSVVNKVISQAILPEIYGGLARYVLLLDLDYRLNMLVLLETLERKLKSLKVSSSECDKVVLKSPSFLKVVRSSSTMELTAVLASLQETILHEKISVIVCDCSSIYNQDKVVFDYLYTTLADVPRTCSVTVIFACHILPEMHSFKFPRSADINWTISKASNCSDKFILTVKHFSNKSKSFEKEYCL